MKEINDWQSQMRRGLLELCILSILEGGPSYGYEIVTRLSVSPAMASGEGTVYPLLRRLKKLGWLETTWRESDSGPPRQYYQLSREGKTYLRALRTEWSRLASSVDEFLKQTERPKK